MKNSKFFTFILVLALTVGLIACSDDSKDETTDEENQDQEQVQDEGNQQQMQGGNNQQQMQQGQQATNQEVKIGSKDDVVDFIKETIEWVKSDAFLEQFRKTIPKSQDDQQRAQGQRQILDQKFMDMAKSHGFENQQSYEATMNKFKEDEDIKKLQQELNQIMQAKMQVIQQEMMQQMQGDKQQQPSQEKK